MSVTHSVLQITPPSPTQQTGTNVLTPFQKIKFNNQKNRISTSKQFYIYEI